jgi:hypothetical protein
LEKIYGVLLHLIDREELRSIDIRRNRMRAALHGEGSFEGAGEAFTLAMPLRFATTASGAEHGTSG